MIVQMRIHDDDGVSNSAHALPHPAIHKLHQAAHDAAAQAVNAV